MDEQDNYSILLETDRDYQEALAALDEQLVYGEELMISIVRLTEAIARYETDNDITHDEQSPASI